MIAGRAALATASNRANAHPCPTACPTPSAQSPGFRTRRSVHSLAGSRSRLPVHGPGA
jgi:hypothetical protein